MVNPLKPKQRRALTMDSWGFAPAVANIKLPTLAELTAITGLNITCHLFRDQEGINGATARVTLPARLCEADDYEVNGSTTYSMSDLVSAWEPQAAAGSDGKKAWETLQDQLLGFLWRRQDVTVTTDLAAGQFVDVVPVQLGTKIPGKNATDASGVYVFTQPVSIVSAPAFNVPILASA
ncbi:hypothetical protein [Nocardioides sp. ChNu-99]|uniref:phage tail tube protein n=1 Tax=Nocardioides sp. ChNu-99 TaxID=2839897 RepID=UPI002404B8C4|nr:hypothetical protein [Nocardioides sp. ChNu-99]MDF9718037.1 hypothetical protein [Nocardioides sp. ChNu-99]